MGQRYQLKSLAPTQHVTILYGKSRSKSFSKEQVKQIAHQQVLSTAPLKVKAVDLAAL